MESSTAEVNPHFRAGSRVRVRLAFPPGHTRAPFFIRGKSGVVDEVVGAYPNPEELAYGNYDAPRLMLYRIRFRQPDVWSGYSGSGGDTLLVDLYENWLEPSEDA